MDGVLGFVLQKDRGKKWSKKRKGDLKPPENQSYIALFKKNLIKL